MAFHSEGAERRWVRQAVMGVLRWRDLPGARSSMGSSSNRTEVIIVALYVYVLVG